jgi:hypothetical protein
VRRLLFVVLAFFKWLVLCIYGKWRGYRCSWIVVCGLYFWSGEWLRVEGVGTVHAGRFWFEHRLGGEESLCSK